MLPQRSHNATRVTLKRGVYYYRRRLPKPHGSELALSLGTKNYREAEHLAALLDQAFNSIVVQMASHSDLPAILKAYLKDQLDADHQYRLQAPPNKPVYAMADEVDDDRDPVDADLEIIDYLLAEAREKLALRNFKSVAKGVAELMAEHNLSEDLRQELAHGLLRANVQALELMRRRALGDEPQIDLQEQLPLSPPTASLHQSSAPSGPLLSELLPAFIEFMTTEKGWRGQATAQNETTYRMFIEWCGDKPIQSYVRKDMGEFFDMLRKLPNLWSKDKRWRGLPLRKVIEQSKDLTVDRLAMKTVKRHFSALGTLFRHHKKRGLYEGENPAYGFDFPTKGRGKGVRKIWAGEKLTKLFESPVWTGCHPHFRSQRGDQIIRDDKFWLPLLGLYHGNRLEEFAQLRREDIKHEDDIWFFNVTDEGERQLKNEQSIRRVPIHPAVLTLGFLEYVEQIAPKNGDMVFPDLRPGGKDNKVGFYFTKWWTAYRKSIGVYERWLDYHSFRHGVTTKLFAAGVSQAVVDELTGHEGEGTSRAVYLHDLPIKLLHEAISKIEWPEASISSASPSAAPSIGMTEP